MYGTKSLSYVKVKCWVESEDQKFSKKLGPWDYFGEPIGDFNTEYA